jgi:peptide/nickel transport system permease protein
MARFLFRRALHAVLVVWLVITAGFFLIHLAPGDPFSQTLEHPGVSESVRAQWRAELGLDRPLGEQYVRWLSATVRGQLGFSYSHRRPVRDVLIDAVPNTLQLLGLALIGSFLIGSALGLFQARRRGTTADHATRATSLFFYSMPEFWLAMVMLLLFAHVFPVLPAGGMFDPLVYEQLPWWERAGDRAAHLVLPVATLTLLNAAAIARFQRAAALDVAHQDFVRTARAKGLAERQVMGRHVRRNALLPVITMVGLALPVLVGGAVFVERVFAWPGMGNLTISAIYTRDYPVVLASMLIGAVMVSLGSLLADVLTAAVDPRTRTA